MLNDRWPEDSVISISTVEMDIGSHNLAAAAAPHTLYNLGIIIQLLFAIYNMHSSS